MKSPLLNAALCIALRLSFSIRYQILSQGGMSIAQHTIAL
jgi:hypothetical protein